MRAARLCLATACLAVALADGEAVTPMEQVKILLQKLKKRVEDEAMVESGNYQKFDRWCDLEKQQARSDISSAENEIEELKADMNEAAAAEQRKTFDIEKLAMEISHKEADLAKDTKQREEDHAEFLEIHGKLQESIDVLNRAKEIMSQQVSKETLVQVGRLVSMVLRTSVARANAAPADRMQAFFQQVASGGPAAAKPRRSLLQQPAAGVDVYEGHSGEVKQVIQDMHDDIASQQKEVQAEEQQEQHSFELLEQAMQAELTSLRRDMDSEKAAKAELQERQAHLEVEISDANKYHEEKMTYLEDVTMSCQEKAREFEARSKSRSEELNAIGEAQTILSSERAKEVQQREGGRGAALVEAAPAPGAQFLQISALTQRAVAAMSADPFGKVKKMIANMVEKLLSEQAQEQEHKAWCDSELAKTHKQQKFHSRQDQKLKSRIEEMTSEVQQLQAKIQDANADIQSMKEAMAEATSIRSTEHAVATAALKDYADAQQMLQKALQVLSDFYRQKRAAAASLLQRGSGQKAAPPPTFSGTDPGAAREDAAEGILNILEISLSDFTRLESETQTEEAEAQKQYDQFAAENRQSIALAETDLKHFAQDQARLERELQAANNDLGEVTVELTAANEYLEKLQVSCDFRGPDFEERQARRKAELESLQNALAIISGQAIA